MKVRPSASRKIMRALERIVGGRGESGLMVKKTKMEGSMVVFRVERRVWREVSPTAVIVAGFCTEQTREKRRKNPTRSKVVVLKHDL